MLEIHTGLLVFIPLESEWLMCHLIMPFTRIHTSAGSFSKLQVVMHSTPSPLWHMFLKMDHKEGCEKKVK